uniref:Secreted RxLR effector peptide protein n=1 Tax=Dendroctonus ponderosae TaxID=77166 RepID=A0AAR5PRA3_DENPD
MISVSFRLLIALFGMCLLAVASEESPKYFLTAAKSVPRIGRSANKHGNSDFEKFFMKASKSVPRIGRRNENPATIEQALWQNPLSREWHSLLKLKSLTKFIILGLNWNDIAYFYEYEPELFASGDLRKALESYLAADYNPAEDAVQGIPNSLNYEAKR